MMINEEVSVIAPRPREDLSPAPNNTFPPAALPQAPLVKIRPARSPAAATLREAWARRELLYLFIWRDLKLRYKQTILGASWVIFQPLMMAIIFTIFLGRLVRVPSDGVPYPIFAYAGLLVWLFFSNAVSGSSYGLAANGYMITKVYFPRIIVPAAIIGVRLVDFLVASLMLVVLMLYYGIRPGWSMLMLPVLVMQLTLLALGVGLWLSVLSIKYRDVGAALPLLLQLWMFASPIIYPASLVPERWQLPYALNPLTGIVEGVRASLFGLEFNWAGMIVSAAITLFLFVYFVLAFCRMEENLIDVL